jgi:hypothetical protein
MVKVHHLTGLSLFRRSDWARRGERTPGLSQGDTMPRRTQTSNTRARFLGGTGFAENLTKVLENARRKNEERTQMNRIQRKERSSAPLVPDRAR